MSEKSISFSGPMVRAILDGRKWQTRRVVKSQPDLIVELTDKEIACYVGPGIKRDTGISERRLSRRERWEDILADELQGLWSQGIRGVVSLNWSQKRQGILDGIIVSREQEGNSKCSSTYLYGISRDAPQCEPPDTSSRRESREQHSREPSMGYAGGELGRSESSWTRDQRGESPCCEVLERRASTHQLGDQERSMQSTTCRNSTERSSVIHWKDCPFNVGLNLWVRETWCRRGLSDDDGAFYRADWPEHDYGPRWRPSIHMPLLASRINLKITGVRCERVQEITADDAVAEGIRRKRSGYYTLRDNEVVQKFAALWDTINEKRGYPWADNPWVWVIEFKRVEE